MSKKPTRKINIFNAEQYLPVYRHLPLHTIEEQFNKTLQHAVNVSQDSANILFGTILLADGREARVQVCIEAEFVEQLSGE